MNQKLFSLEGKVALITGGNSGLGRAMAIGLKSAGAKVQVTGRNPEKNQSISEELDDPEAVHILDVRNEEDIEKTITNVVEKFGQLDILINNAGYVGIGSVLDLPLEDWNAVIGTHLTGSFLCARNAAKFMADRGNGGKIINIGSMYSIFGLSYITSYVSAKTGVLGLTRSLAVELAVSNIQVNAILPGWHWTEMTKVMKDTPRDDEIRRKTPAGRWGTAEDLIGTAVFLSSSASDFVTGVCIPVDGGYSIAESLLYD